MCVFSSLAYPGGAFDRYQMNKSFFDSEQMHSQLAGQHITPHASHPRMHAHAHMFHHPCKYICNKNHSSHPLTRASEWAYMISTKHPCTHRPTHPTNELSTRSTTTHKHTHKHTHSLSSHHTCLHTCTSRPCSSAARHRVAAQSTWTVSGECVSGFRVPRG